MRAPDAYHRRTVANAPSPWRAQLCAALTTCLLAGCAATHGGRPHAPALEPTLDHYAGSPLAGAAQDPGELAPDPATSYSVRARLYALGHPAGAVHAQPDADPASGGPGPFAPLSAHTRLAAATRGDEPFRPSGDLGLAARVAGGDEARTWVGELEAAGEFERKLLAEFEGALPVGVTASLALTSRAALLVPGEGALRSRVALQVARGADGLEAAVVREELAAQPGDTGAIDPEARVLLREYGLLDLAPVLDGAPLVLELLRPPGETQEAPLCWVVEISAAPADAEAHARAHERMLAETVANGRAAQARRSHLARQEEHGREMQNALDALGGLSQSRPALVFLATATGAGLAGDLALLVDDETLERFVKEVLASVPDPQAAAQEGATLGFVLESRAWAFLTRGMDEQPLAPEVLGLLVHHGGELARSLGAVEDLLVGAKDLPALEARIVQENRDALEDASAGVRVRAFDWLTARSIAPPRYDPLGPLPERRKALAAADAAAEAAAAAGGPK
jgi:hypothetical protein